MKEVILYILGIIQKLFDNKIFWGWAFFVTILWSRPTTLDKLFITVDSIKELSFLIGGIIAGKILNKGN
mgnify:CR=1 FL=1